MRVAPAASMTVTPWVGMERAPRATRRMRLPWHEHFARERVLAAAVEDAYAGEQNICHCDLP